MRGDKWDHRRGEVKGKESLKTTHLDAAIDRDKMKHEHKMDKSKDVFNEQFRRRKSMVQMEDEQDAKELARALKAKQMMSSMKMAEKQQDFNHQNQQMSMQTDAMQAVMAQAIQSGAADSGSLQEMMRQMTMQKALDREGNKVASLSEAEKARNNMDTYKAAEDRERAHQTNMNREAATMMQAAKQNGPKTLVQGGGGGDVSTQVRMNVSEGKEESAACWSCGKKVQADFAICPFCGETLQ